MRRNFAALTISIARVICFVLRIDRSRRRSAFTFSAICPENHIPKDFKPLNLPTQTPRLQVQIPPPANPFPTSGKPQNMALPTLWCGRPACTYLPFFPETSAVRAIHPYAAG